MLGIADYTLHTWGKAQAASYLGELEDFCVALAKNPGLGRSCEEIRAGLRRMEHGRHVIFYRTRGGGILITRILHERMLPEKHSLGD